LSADWRTVVVAGERHLRVRVDEPRRDPNLQPRPPTPLTATPSHHLRRPAQKATRGKRNDSHNRLRTVRVGDTCSISLRVAGGLHHIGVGRTHARTHVLMLIQDLHIRVINAATGELIRQLTIDPTRDYQPRNVPSGRPKKKP
jgi:hypothetical protein